MIRYESSRGDHLGLSAISSSHIRIFRIWAVVDFYLPVVAYAAYHRCLKAQIDNRIDKKLTRSLSSVL